MTTVFHRKCREFHMAFRWTPRPTAADHCYFRGR